MGGPPKPAPVTPRGEIEGQVNPDLNVPAHALVQINLINGDGVVHDIAVPAFGAQSENVTGKGAATAIAFRTKEGGIYEYLCTIPVPPGGGHVRPADRGRATG